MKKYCCVKTCKNNNSKIKTEHNTRRVKFFSFPSDNPHMPWLQQKRKDWINAVKQYAKHPDNWEPSKYSFICSSHFIGNFKSENPLHPSYLPTIFGSKINAQQSMQNNERWKRQLLRTVLLEKNKSKTTFKVPIKVDDDDTERPNKQARSITCQTDKCFTETFDFMCNKNCDKSVETPVNIVTRNLILSGK